MPVYMIGAAIAMPLGSKIQETYSVKFLIFVGGTLVVSSIFLLAHIEEFWKFLIVQSLVGGTGYGILYFLPYQSAQEYFPEHKAIVSAIVAASYSIF